MENINISSVIEELVKEYIEYTKTFRSSIQPNKLSLFNTSDFLEEKVRESLLEHVGHLPITATKLFPFIEDNTVVLGDSLIMLAVHDIGELDTGDIPIFVKSNDHADKETQAALSRLNPIYHKYYLDMSTQTTNSGKFAKSIDKIVADILELSMDADINVKRYQSMGISKDEIVTKKRESKMRYMLWNTFLKEFYEALLSKLEVHFR